MRTEESQRLTLVRGGAGEGESGDASTIFGPVRAGLTTLQTTPPHLHTESLNDLVKIVDDLVSKYLEASDMLITVTERLVKRGRSGYASSTTEEDMFSCGGCGDIFWGNDGKIVHRDTLVEFTCSKCKSVID